ncbi:MAG: response regulator [Myxococcales bacterium]|nr:response regulator [Myxococcota bacterium]MDW8284030.1 response regulator [Myxococcales bacterium]
MPFLKKVVVGEDDDAIAHLIEATLGDAGYLCLRARNGEEALLLAKTEAPDLLVLDVLMPRMDGIHVVRKLKADPVHSRVPVLMMTALSSTEDKVRGLDAGADDYLTKPFDLRELLARARALIRQSRRERDRSPTTQLPGSETFEAHLQDRLASGEPFALLFCDLDRFGEFLDHHGWRRAEEVLAAYGRALQMAAQEVPATMLTHLGGDDFAFLTAIDQAEELRDSVRRAEAEVLQAAAPCPPLRVFVLDSSQGSTADDFSRALAQLRRRHPQGPEAAA